MNTENVASLIEESKRRIGTWYQLAELVRQCAKLVEDQITALEKYRAVQQAFDQLGMNRWLDELSKAMAEASKNPELMIKAQPLETLGKPKVQVYEEILVAKGPMHRADLAREAQSRGILYTGTLPQEEQVRRSLYASKRFQNFGNNVWGLVGQQAPSSTNGHKQEQPSLINIR